MVVELGKRKPLSPEVAVIFEDTLEASRRCGSRVPYIYIILGRHVNYQLDRCLTYDRNASAHQSLRSLGDSCSTEQHVVLAPMTWA